MSNHQAINLLKTAISNNISSTGYNNVRHPTLLPGIVVPSWTYDNHNILEDACDHKFYPVKLTFNNKEETFCSGSIAVYLTNKQYIIDKIYHTNCSMKHPIEQICWYSIRTGNSNCFSPYCKFQRIIRPCRIEQTTNPNVQSVPLPVQVQSLPAQVQSLPAQVPPQVPAQVLPLPPQVPAQVLPLPPQVLPLPAQVSPLLSQVPPLPQLPPLPSIDQLVSKAVCNSCSLFKEESSQKGFIMNNLIKHINGFRLATNNKLELHVVYGTNNTMWIDTSIYWGRNSISMQCYLKLNAKGINKLLASNNYDIIIQEQDGYIRSLNYEETHPGRNLLDSKLTQPNVESGRNLSSNLPIDRTRGRLPLNRTEPSRPIYSESFCDFIFMINNNIGKWHNYEAILGKEYPEFVGIEKIHCDFMKTNRYTEEYFQKILDEVIESNQIYSSYKNRDRSRSRERPNSYGGPFRDSYHR